MLRVSVLMPFLLVHPAWAQSPPPKTSAPDVRVLRFNMAKEALSQAKKDCLALVEAKRDQKTELTLATCLSQDGATTLRYSIQWGATKTDPAVIELLSSSL